MTIYRVAAIAALTLTMAVVHSDITAHGNVPDLGCHQVTSAVEQLHQNLPFPPYFSEPEAAKRGGEFDVNRTLGAFPHLAMQDGHTLDYVYHQDGMGGYPLLYARRNDQPPYANEAEYDMAPKQPDYLTFVSPQDNPEGYLEYAVFAQSANQFYLDWHANYNDWTVLCGPDDIEAVIQSVSARQDFGRPMTDGQKQAARAIPDQQPTVVLTGPTATVSMLVFTKWGGFYRRTTTINRDDHSIVDKHDTSVVEYDCGVAF